MLLVGEFTADLLKAPPAARIVETAVPNAPPTGHLQQMSDDSRRPVFKESQK
jgi:hypothetical protein